MEDYDEDDEDVVSFDRSLSTYLTDAYIFRRSYIANPFSCLSLIQKNAVRKGIDMYQSLDKNATNCDFKDVILKYKPGGFLNLKFCDNENCPNFISRQVIIYNFASKEFNFNCYFIRESFDCVVKLPFLTLYMQKVLISSFLFCVNRCT